MSQTECPAGNIIEWPDGQYPTSATCLGCQVRALVYLGQYGVIRPRHHLMVVGRCHSTRTPDNPEGVFGWRYFVDENRPREPLAGEEILRLARMDLNE